jgi:hypothetical protein
MKKTFLVLKCFLVLNYKNGTPVEAILMPLKTYGYFNAIFEKLRRQKTIS